MKKNKSVKLFDRIVIIFAILVVIFIALLTLDYFDVVDVPILAELDNETLEFQMTDEEIAIQHSFMNSGVDRKNRDYSKYVFVGDSRYVGMEKYSDPYKDVFISEVGVGYSFLTQNMSKIIAECDSDTALIIGLGVNDLVNCTQYISTINDLAVNTDCQIYYMSVNPVDDITAQSHGYNMNNSSIEEFNSTIKAQLNDDIVFIDTNKYLNDDGYESTDGIHYSESTYEKIYLYLKGFSGPDNK